MFGAVAPVNILRKGNVLDEIITVFVEQDDPTDDVSIIGSETLRKDAEIFLEEALLATTDNANQEGASSGKVARKYRGNLELATCTVEIGDEFFSWDIVEIDLLSGAGYQFGLDGVRKSRQILRAHDHPESDQRCGSEDDQE